MPCSGCLIAVGLNSQSAARNPPAKPDAQRKSSGLASTRHMLLGSVFPLSERKYAVLRPMIPLPIITVEVDDVLLQELIA